MLVTGGIARSFVVFAPPVGRRWPLALEAGLAMALPVAVATALGHTILGLVCALGAFTCLYASNLRRADRARMLPFVVAGFVVCAALGAVLASSLVGMLVVLVVLAIASTWMTLAFRIGPPGAMMFALVYGASARIAGPAELDGGAVPAALVVLLVTGGAVLAYLIVVAPLVVPRVRVKSSSGAFGALIVRRPLSRHEWFILARVAGAVIVAAALSVPLGSHRAYWIVVAVLAVVQAGRARRHLALRALHRVAGTFVGLGVFALLVLVRPGGYLLAVVLGGLQVVAELVVVRHYALALVFITPLALTITATAASGSPTEVALERLVDTVVGVTIGCIALLVPETARHRR